MKILKKTTLYMPLIIFTVTSLVLLMRIMLR